jgi:nitrate reductase delta subunit
MKLALKTHVTRDQRVVYSAAALLLSYPDEQLLASLPMVEAAASEVGVGELFAPTITHLRSMPLMDAQAWHVQEFDLSRRHALHLTYWTDGDTRRRGEVLAAIKQTYRDSGLLVDLDGELPDYLPMVLEFCANGDPEAGVGLLNTYRASLELLRLGLERDDLPHAGVVAAICRTLGGPTPASRAEVQRLIGGPPTETVGLEGYSWHS